MDSAPLLPTNPPPCDEDYARSFREQPASYSTESIDIDDIANNPAEQSSDIEPDLPQADSGLTVRQEIRELQRLMLEVARSDEFGSARASAARAYRDLEVLRCAKRGKPLALNAHVRLESKTPSPILTLAPISKAA